MNNTSNNNDNNTQNGNNNTPSVEEAFRGLDISIVTTAKTDEEARALLTHLGFPFRK